MTPEKLNEAQQYIDFVKTNLEPLAQHLKVSVEWLWDILVMQARVEAIVYLIICLSMSITTVSLGFIFFKSLKKATFYRIGGQSKYVHKKTGKEIPDIYDIDYSEMDKYEKRYEKNQTNTHGYVAWTTGVGAALMIFVSSITMASSLERIVTGLVNPEFRAIEKIVEYAKTNNPQNNNQEQQK